jgi:YbbR domain-containing protein
MTLRKMAARVFANWPVKMLCFAAAVLLFIFHNMTNLSERYFTIPLQLRSNPTLSPASEYPLRVRVSLRGDEDKVFSVLEEDITAFADLSRETGEGVFKFPIMIRKRATGQNSDPIEIRVDPDTITLTLERRMVRNVRVAPIIRILPASGYNLEQYSVFPPAVTVEGPRSRIQKLASIGTDEIDLSGKREAFSMRVRLVKPDPLVQLPGGDTVEFRGEIRVVAGQKSDELPLPEATP